MDKELVFTTFRQGHLAPNVHLSELRLVKDAFYRIKVGTAKMIRLAEADNMDVEDLANYRHDTMMKFYGSVQLMLAIEKLAGMKSGELVTSIDCIIDSEERLVCNG